MQITAHFSNIRKEIISQIKPASKSIDLAVAWLTDEDILRELYHKAKEGIPVRIAVSDAKENFVNIEPYSRLLAAKASLFVGKRAFLHHKFALIDDRVLINGSYNWSYPARYNEENILILRRDQPSPEDDRVFMGFRAKHEYFCKLGGIPLMDRAALNAYKTNPKDSALLQANMDQEEIVLREHLEERIRESFDKARALKIPISQYLLERMELDGGGVEFVRRILHDEMTSGEMKSGFKKLEEFMPHKVELSLEYLASRPEFQRLFTEEERAFCIGLMKKYDLSPQ